MNPACTKETLRFNYHITAIKLVGLCNRLGIIKDDVAEDKSQSHTSIVVGDILPRIYGTKAWDKLAKRLDKEIGS